MLRLIAAATLPVLLLTASLPAADTPPAGHWKFRLQEQGQVVTFLFAFSESEGKWVGDFLSSSAPLKQEPKFSSVQVADGKLKFSLGFGEREFLSFDGVVAKDGEKISGSVSQFGGPLTVTELARSQLKKVDDPIALAREDLAQMEDGPELFAVGEAILSQAAVQKLPPEDVRTLTERLARASAAFGPRWERATALRLATTLAGQEGHAAVAFEQAQRAEKMLAKDSPIEQQLEVYGTLARVAEQAKKPDEAKKYTGLVKELEVRDHAEFTKAGLGFTPEAYKGRKGKSNRTVVLEVFTGVECAPCAAVDLATHGLLKTFKPNELIVLEYHLPVAGPDPLMTQDGLQRFEAYGLKAAPSVKINGKDGPAVPGLATDAGKKYEELRKLIEPPLETNAPVKLALTVSSDKKGYSAKAVVKDLQAPGEKTVLRFAVVEPEVRYAGQSGVRYHANVVRALPGGVKGFPLTKKDHEQTITVDPAELRGQINKFLDEVALTEGESPKAERPLDLANLKLVALVQNDATGEVLQAVQVELK